MPDRPLLIHVHELEVLGHVGVTEAERSRAQRLVLNLSVEARLDAANLNDDIAATVNYSAIAHEAQEIVREQHPHLIETLAAAIADRLLQTFPISRAEVEVRKFVLPEASYVSVTVSRRS